MNKEHQRRVRELFDAALDQPVYLRREFLVRAVNGDRHLFEAVEKLLRASERSAGVLDTPIRQRPMVDTDPRRPGSSIGAYKVLQRLSGGGMGIVYQAVRADEVYQRICAVKVIRPELCSNWLVERFKQERRILGKLDHINIARIVDGGSTPEGLLYFVMDYVDGPAIDKVCNQHALNGRQRLALFQQTCAAVQYLHQNGVIHGDLKPPNILVDNSGTVKLVDFGIASVISASEVQAGKNPMPLMTPAYASPEQLRGDPLTRTSDVYSLGIILYELLTGVQPFPPAGMTTKQLLEVITTHDPTPPSFAAKAMQQSVATPIVSSHELKGDLDSIVLRVIHRDPARRYQSAADLSTDISLHLQGRPVAARKSGPIYKSRKFLVRHARAAIGAVVVAILLATAGWQGLELHKRYEQAQQLEAEVRSLQSLLDEELKARQAEMQHSSKNGKPLPITQLRDSQLHQVSRLADAYRTSFSESVRLWPGMSRKRRALLDRTGQYLQQAEPYIDQDPRASELLATAWLWLANLEGNPQSSNLHDRSRASVSIDEAQRLLEKSPGAPATLIEQVQTAARQIGNGR